MEFPKSYGAGRSDDEKEALKKAVEELAAQNKMQDLEKGLLEWHIEEQEKEHEKKEEEHGIDHLTGVYTRKFFNAKLEHEFKLLNQENERRKNAKAPTEIVLVFIDLDHFKEVNDTFGHARGDDVLREAARRLQHALREEDTLARYGGDEFVALLPNTGTASGATVAEKLRAALDEDPVLKESGITGSFGVASSAEAASVQDLIEHADRAVYAAKAGGRNRVEMYQGA